MLLWKALIPVGAAAVAAALILLVWPGAVGGQAPLNIESVTAGNAGAFVPEPSTRADLPQGSVSLGGAESAPDFRNIWAGNSNSSFPMVMVNGAYYRLLSTPKKLSDKQLGSAVGTVQQYTTEMSGSGLCSNTVLQGETVWQVRGMGQAAVAARIDGTLRVFQRVTADGQGAGASSLAEAIAQSGVKELSLSGVGRVRDQNTAQRLLSTLLDNAVKYTPVGSHIWVETFREGDMAHVRVSDDGPGIPDRDKPRLFEKFYTGEGPVADSRRSLGRDRSGPE